MHQLNGLALLEVAAVVFGASGTAVGTLQGTVTSAGNQVTATSPSTGTGNGY